MKKLFVPALFMILIGATTFWYFGHYRPAQKMPNTKSKYIYKATTPITPKRSVAKQRSIEDADTTPEKSDARKSESYKVTEGRRVDAVPERGPLPPANTNVQSQSEGTDENRVASSEQETSEPEGSHEEENEGSELTEEAIDEYLKEGMALEKEAYSVMADQLRVLPLAEQLQTLEQMREAILQVPDYVKSAYGKQC